MLRILILNLSASSADEVNQALAGQGYEIAVEAGLDVEQIESLGPELLITEATPSDLSCCGIITQIKSREQTKFIRVLMLVQGGALERARALDLGADDYVSKPFGVEELSARIRAALRHRLQQDGEKPIFRSGELAVDLVRRIVTVAGEEVKLTPREYDLLRLLVSHAGKVLTHKFILHQVWGAEADVQYLRIYIRTLRQKLEADPEQPNLILTEQGVGYRLRASD